MFPRERDLRKAEKTEQKDRRDITPVQVLVSMKREATWGISHFR